MKTTLSLLLLICSILVSFTSLSGGGSGGSGNVPPPPGMPACAVNPPPGQTACTATPICNIHGFCGTTSSSYTVDTWPQLGTTQGGGAFCGSIENNAFLEFTAESTSISFDAYVYNCPSGDAIQVMIFSAASCNSGPVTSYTCLRQMRASSTPYNISASGLTPGEKYYIMIDGWAGDVCDYTFVATSGVSLPLGLSTGDEVTVCMGETVTTIPFGGDGTYTWDPNPDITQLAGNEILITPPFAVGSYQYVVHSQGGVPNCPVTNDYTLTVHVEACCTIDPQVASISCDVNNSVYAANIEVNFLNPPATGDLVIRSCNGDVQTFPVGSIGSSPFIPATISGISLNDPTCNIEAYFSGSTNCTHVLAYNAPITSTPTFDPITVCEDDQAPTLPATSLEGIPGTWSPATINTSLTGTTNYTFTPASTYCSPTVDLGVVVNPKPDIGVVNSNILYDCTSGTGVLLEGISSTSGATYSWTDTLGGLSGIISGETTLTATANSSGVYVFTVTDPTTGCVNTDTVTVTGNGNEPIVSIDLPAVLDCNNSITILTGHATSGVSPVPYPFTYEWSTTNGNFTSATDTLTVGIDGLGVYTLTVTDTDNGCVTSTMVEVIGNLDIPLITPLGDIILFCNIEDTLAILSGISSVNGIPGAVSWSTSDGNITVTQDEHAGIDMPGTYVFTATDPSNGCSSTDTVLVLPNTVHVDAGPDLPICNDSTATVIIQGSSNTPGVGFSWTGTDGSVIMTDFSNLPNPEVPYVATYILTVTDSSNNCNNKDTMEVYLYTPLTVFPDTTVCDTSFQVPAGSVTFSVNFSWSEQNGNGTFNDTTILEPLFTADSGIVHYHLILTDICSSDTVNVNLIPSPAAVSPSADCDNPKVVAASSYEGGTWTATGPGSVNFSPSSTIGTGSLTPEVTTVTASPGTYIVTFQSNGVCNYTYEDTLVFYPSISLFNDTTVCATSFQVPSGSVIASGNGTWSHEPAVSGSFNDPAILNPVFTPGAGIEYILTYNDICDTVSARVIFPPQPIILTPPAYSCNDMSEVLTSISYGPGAWTVMDYPETTWHEDTAVVFNPGNLTNGGLNNVDSVLVSSHPTAGTYTFVFTDNTCGYSESVTLNFLPYPWTEINDTTLCINVPYTLAAWESPYNVGYDWSTGETGQSIIVTQPGVYYVDAYNDCYSYIDSATITYVVCDIEAPNVISLSSLAGNNIWYVDAYGIVDYKCLIVNRWGNLIFEYNDVNQSWDGRDMSGNIVPEGVYFYSLEATYESGEQVKKHGFIHVVH